MKIKVRDLLIIILVGAWLVYRLNQPWTPSEAVKTTSQEIPVKQEPAKLTFEDTLDMELKRLKKFDDEFESLINKDELITVPSTNIQVPTIKGFTQKANLEYSGSFVAQPLLELATKFSKGLETALACKNYVVEDTLDKTKLLANIACDSLTAEDKALTSDLLPFYSAPNIKVYTIFSYVEPKEWVLDNVVYQGLRLRWQPAETSRGKEIEINGLKFWAIQAACCGGYEMTYLYKAGPTQIIAFTTSFGDTSSADNSSNAILDTYLKYIKVN